MASSTIDYEALARQAGAISSAPPQVDYAALAKQAGAVSSQPAQQQSEPDGILKTAGKTILNFLKPSAQNPYPGMGQEQKAQAAVDARQEDLQRKAEFRSPLYRVAAPLASVVADVPTMEAGAREGNQRKVIGAALGSAAIAASPLAVEGAVKGVKAIDLNAPLRGTLAKRMAETPPGEMFSRGEVNDAARANGVKLDLADATGSKVAGAVKKVNQYSLTGQGTYEATSKANGQALSQWAENEASKYAPESTPREALGPQIQERLRNDLNAKKNAASQAFDELDKSVGQNTIQGKETVQARAQEILDANKPYYDKHPELAPAKALKIVQDLAKNDVYSWSELHQMRSDLMEFYRNNPDIVKGKSDAWIQQMVGTIDKSMTDASSGLSGKQLADFRRANQTWESVKSTYDNPQSPLYHAIRSNYPSQVVGMLSKATPELATQVRSLLGDLEGPFQRQFVESQLTAKDGATLDLKNLNSRLSRVPNDFMESILGPDGAKQLRLLGKVAQKATYDSNPSGTAKSAVGAGELLHAVSNPVGGAVELGGNYAAAKAMNSPRVVDYLTKKPSVVLKAKPRR